MKTLKINWFINKKLSSENATNTKIQFSIQFLADAVDTTDEKIPQQNFIFFYARPWEYTQLGRFKYIRVLIMLQQNVNNGVFFQNHSLNTSFTWVWNIGVMPLPKLLIAYNILKMQRVGQMPNVAHVRLLLLSYAWFWTSLRRHILSIFPENQVSWDMITSSCFEKAIFLLQNIFRYTNQSQHYMVSFWKYSRVPNNRRGWNDRGVRHCNNY